MSNKARIVGDTAVDVTPAAEVENRFTPDIAAEFVDVPDAVVIGSRLGSDGTWTAPPAASASSAPASPAAYQWNPVDWLNQRWPPLSEAAARALAATDPLVGVFVARISDPRALIVDTSTDGVKQAVGYLQTLAMPSTFSQPNGTKVLTPAQAAAILAPR